MAIFLSLLKLIGGFVLLIVGADIFVDGASKLAEKFKIPQIVIGLTIVAFGTSAPEAAISIVAGVKGSADLAVSNVLGSNIMNILLILGIAACFTPLAVQKNTARIEIPFVIFITAALMGLGLLGHNISRIDGAILWVLMILFLVYLFRTAKKGKQEAETEEKTDDKPTPIWLILIKIILGAAAIVFGSNLTVDGATNLATLAGMEERLIGLTIVAFGTSLPELVTSVMAAIKKKADIAVGNIVGSNIFNILFVLATTALVAKGGVVYSKAFIFDNIAAIISALILFLAVIKGQKVKRLAGIIMLVVYVAYFVYILVDPFGLTVA